MTLRVTHSLESVNASRMLPLDREGLALLIESEPHVAYEAMVRVGGTDGGGHVSALVQFSTPTGGRIGQAHVAPEISEELGRYCVIDSGSRTGMVRVCFEGARKLTEMKLIFRAASDEPLLISEDIFIQKIEALPAQPKKTHPAKPATPPEKGRLSWVQKPLKRALDRLFMRRTIASTHNEIVSANQDFARFELSFQTMAEALDKRLGLVEAKLGEGAELADTRITRFNQSFEVMSELLEQRIHYLEAKLDAYAEASDSIDAAMGSQFMDRHGASDARLGVIGDSLAKLMTERTDEIVEKTSKVLADGADDIVRRVEKSAQSRERRLERTLFNETRQREALSTLNLLLKLDYPLPPTRGWAASPDVLLHLYQHIASAKPQTLVELGSGVSTIVAAAALRANGQGGMIHSLDHDEVYAQETREELARHGLEGFAVVHYAPLGDWTPPSPTELGEQWLWYGVPEAVTVLEKIDLLIVDGPPEASGDHARYPAVPQFASQLAPGSVVMLDDAGRPHEQESAEAWSREYGLSLKLMLRADREFEKGLAVLRVEG